MERRLNRLDILYRRRAPQSVHQTCEYDLSVLDTREQYELFVLLEGLEGPSPRTLSDDEEERLDALAEKVKVTGCTPE